MAAMASPSSVHPPRVEKKEVTRAYRDEVVVKHTQCRTILRWAIPLTQAERFHSTTGKERLACDVAGVADLQRGVGIFYPLLLAEKVINVVYDLHPECVYQADSNESVFVEDIRRPGCTGSR